MGTRNHSTYLSPEVASRDLCPDTQGSDSGGGPQGGLAIPHYGGYTSTPTPTKPKQEGGEVFTFDADVETTRKTATCLQAIQGMRYSLASPCLDSVYPSCFFLCY